MFSWNFPYRSQRMPVLAKNIVATSQPLAAQAGLAMLAKGGNAVDAGLAAAITLTWWSPRRTASAPTPRDPLGWPAPGGPQCLGRSPAGWTPERFAGKTAMPTLGWDSVTVPGCVSAWVTLSKRYGKLPFEQLFEPAIRYARESFMVSPITAISWANQAVDRKRFSEFAWTFLPKDRAPHPGERFFCPQQAETLEDIAATKGESFYRGHLAERIALSSISDDGAMTAEDLATHRCDWVDPISVEYRGYHLHEMPPNGQGIAALAALGILRHFDVAALPVDSAESLHLQIEAMKMALADTWAHVTDPAAMRVTPEQMLDAGYLAGRAKKIDMKRAQDHAAEVPAGGGTVYLTTADERGMMFSYIQSNYMGFGSGIVVPGHRHQHAEPRRRLQPQEGPPQRGRAAQAPVPDDHPRVPHARRPAGDVVRRHGRQHAVAGACADGHALRGLQPEPAGLLGWPALDRQPRFHREYRGRDPGVGEGGARAPWPPHRAERPADVRLRRRAADLQVRGRVLRRLGPPQGRLRHRFLSQRR
jgi:gamma-glutamyltranspeptidase/glutathione hydrolase